MCAPVPVKNCLFVCSVGLINGGLTGYHSQVIWGLSLGYQPQKVGTDMCTAPSREKMETWSGIEGGDGGSISHLFLSLGRIKASP